MWVCLVCERVYDPEAIVVLLLAEILGIEYVAAQGTRCSPTFEVLVFSGGRCLRFSPGSGPVVQLFTGQVVGHA